MRKWPALLVLVLAFLPNLRNVHAQSPSSGPIRTVLAIERVSGPIQEPTQLTLARVVIPAGAKTRYLGASAMVYLTAGQAIVSKERDVRTVRENEGFHIPANAEVSFETPTDSKAELLIYRLLGGADATPTAALMGTPASATEVHRMRLSASLMKDGPFEFSMTRVTLPAGATRPRPHTRSGAALYYVLSEGQITIWPEATVESLKGDSRTESRATGAVQEEPYGFIHSWSPGSQGALILLQANISQEGSPEIIFVK
jgi:quercetin dioxygenase-like cupin family protein